MPGRFTPTAGRLRERSPIFRNPGAALKSTTETGTVRAEAPAPKPLHEMTDEDFKAHARGYWAYAV